MTAVCFTGWICKRKWASDVTRWRGVWFLFWMLALVLTGCELIGFVGEARARELASKGCNSFRLEEVQPPTQIRVEWMTADAAKKRGLVNLSAEPNTLVWFANLEGTWQISGGPAFVDNPNRPPFIFHHCIVVLDGKTGDVLMTHAEP